MLRENGRVSERKVLTMFSICAFATWTSVGVPPGGPGTARLFAGRRQVTFGNSNPPQVTASTAFVGASWKPTPSAELWGVRFGEQGRAAVK